MTERFAVGIQVGKERRSVVVDAEDALMAALKTKLDEPRASINYVRRHNARGDRRHPHERLTDDE